VGRLSASESREAFRHIAESIEMSKEMLSELDGAIGDGDHGLSIARGFRAVAKLVESDVKEDVGQLWSDVGTSLIRVIGGATGPLFGTFFLQAGRRAMGQESVGVDDVAGMFAAGLAGVKAIGKAEVGEKTLIDALQPACEALESAAASGRSMSEALRVSAEAAEAGAEATKGMRATKGRARYLGERSIGHQDAGATSISLIVRSLHEYVEGLDDEP